MLTAKKSPLAKKIPLRSATDNRLLEISRSGLLSLSLLEMKAIQAYFAKERRDPTDVELETIAQTWSEHCKHKTFSGIIEYQEEGRGSRVYDHLLKSTIMRVTEELDRPWCWSTFRDNAGVIEFDDQWGIAFKAETHNHPSALEPYGGAGTGLGGVIRDILGVGLGAKPVLNTDVFAFAPPDIAPKKIPKGVLPPRRIIEGVVAGVRDYGNRMGIPTANGAVYFDDRFVANPLVFCGTVGLIPKDKVDKSVESGDFVVSMGGRTGRDGIHGATFSSAALTEGIASSVVQIGHAIMEKRVMDVLLQARDLGLYRAVTDCGAGGFSSAVGELGAETGVVVDLEKAPLKYEGLLPWEIWLSESQERMVLAVPPVNWAELKALCDREEVEATVIGEFVSDKKLTLRYDGEAVGSLSMEFMHDGMPRIHRIAKWKPVPDAQNSKLRGVSSVRVRASDLAPILLDLLGHPNIASKKWIVRQYDHEVQGGSVVKPFVGFDQSGPSDACVFRPRFDSPRAVIVSNGFNPSYGDIDPYWMAAAAIDEALRNLVAVGGDIRHAAILDNFCWGDPEDPRELAALVRACQACYDVGKGFGVPFISGKDSLNNTWRDRKGKIHSIPRSLLISAIGVMPDASFAITMDLKEPGNVIYAVGETREELGGTHLWKVLGQATTGAVPHVQVAQAQETFTRLHDAITKGYVRACHDLSEGGLAVAAAEMAFGGGWGADINLQQMPTSGSVAPAALLFSETPSRFLAEVPRTMQKEFENILGQHAAPIGRVTRTKTLVLRYSKQVLVRQPLARLRRAWEGEMSTPRALVLRTAGTNCDVETAYALKLAGADPSVRHINEILAQPSTIQEFKLLVIPGGFSYGDDIAAGKILANELRYKLGPALTQFVSAGKRVIGICNGFQVLVKTGFLPGNSRRAQTVTLSANDSGQFQCHWVTLKRESSACKWLDETDLSWDLPIAHGEGKFIAQDPKTLAALEKNGHVLFRYKGTNPNGSQNAIAGLCSADGNVVGLMPHPERHMLKDQHPLWTRRTESDALPVGLQFFQAAVNR